MLGDPKSILQEDDSSSFSDFSIAMLSVGTASSSTGELSPEMIIKCRKLIEEMAKNKQTNLVTLKV